MRVLQGWSPVNQGWPQQRSPTGRRHTPWTPGCAVEGEVAGATANPKRPLSLCEGPPKRASTVCLSHAGHRCEAEGPSSPDQAAERDPQGLRPETCTTEGKAWQGAGHKAGVATREGRWGTRGFPERLLLATGMARLQNPDGHQIPSAPGRRCQSFIRKRQILTEPEGIAKGLPGVCYAGKRPGGPEAHADVCFGVLHGDCAQFQSQERPGSTSPPS